MICYTEKEIFRSIKNDKIIKRFKDMKTWRMLVSRNNLVVWYMFSSSFKTLKLNSWNLCH
jgi:hypothetical protein